MCPCVHIFVCVCRSKFKLRKVTETTAPQNISSLIQTTKNNIASHNTPKLDNPSYHGSKNRI